MFYICLYCGDTWGGKRDAICPSCLKDTLIEVDENIALIVLALNKKGYKTWNSCAGHLYDSSGYIMFDSKHDLPEVKYPPIRIDNDGARTAIRWVSHATDINSIDADLQMIRCALAEYVAHLPDAKGHYT